MNSTQGGRCQVLETLGEGGKSIVFLCQDTVLGRKVAIKLLKEETFDPEGLLRFQREVQALARLMHPNVATAHDIGQEGGRHYLLQSARLLCSGMVSQLSGLSRRGKRNPPQAKGWTRP